MEAPLTYKGLPLVRSNDEFYYGNPGEKVIVYLKVLSTKQVGNQTVSDKIHVSLISTDTTLDPIRRMKKQAVQRTGCRCSMAAERIKQIIEFTTKAEGTPSAFLYTLILPRQKSAPQHIVFCLNCSV